MFQGFHELADLLAMFSKFRGHRAESAGAYHLVVDSCNSSASGGRREVFFVLGAPGGVPLDKPIKVNAAPKLNVKTEQRDGRLVVIIPGARLVTYEVTAETRPGRVVIDLVDTKSHVKVTIRLPKGAQCHLCGDRKSSVMQASDVEKIGLQMGLLPRDPVVIRKVMKMVPADHLEQIARCRGFVRDCEVGLLALRQGWTPPKDAFPFDVFDPPNAETYNAALAAFDEMVAAKRTVPADPAAEAQAAQVQDIDAVAVAQQALEAGTSAAVEPATGSNGDGASDGSADHDATPCAGACGDKA